MYFMIIISVRPFYHNNMIKGAMVYLEIGTIASSLKRLVRILGTSYPVMNVMNFSTKLVQVRGFSGYLTSRERS